MEPDIEYVTGDIERHLKPSDWMVVPTNIGWTNKGENPMGRGVAKVAARKYPWLPAWYGAICQEMKENTPVLAHPNHHVILFPTKPLQPWAPYLSWKAPSDRTLIRRGLDQLATLAPKLEPQRGRILVPLLGAGAGEIPPGEALDLINLRLLSIQRTVLVLTEEDYNVIKAL
jgi:hypothetical protein